MNQLLNADEGNNCCGSKNHVQSISTLTKQYAELLTVKAGGAYSYQRVLKR
jgi:hypothetical protein